MTRHRLEVAVYLEDTDAQGIVYYANYLKFFERARTEILKAKGASPVGYGERELRFVVHEVQLKYHRPALLGDTLGVSTEVQVLSPYRLAFLQAAYRDGEKKPLVDGTTEVVCIDRDGHLVELPKELFPGA